jgi:hypothetical protein
MDLVRYAKSAFSPVQGKLQSALAKIKDISAKLERETFLASEESTYPQLAMLGLILRAMSWSDCSSSEA